MCIRPIVAAAATAAAIALSTPCAQAASLVATVGAEVIAPLGLTKRSDLSFGKFSSSGNGTRTMTIAPRGVMTAGTGVAVASSSGVSAAEFTVAGEPSLTYAITLPTSVRIMSASSSMALTAFTSSIGETGILDGSGTQTFSVGATLEIGAGQAMERYTGQFTVAVEYN